MHLQLIFFVVKLHIFNLALSQLFFYKIYEILQISNSVEYL